MKLINKKPQLFFKPDEIHIWQFDLDKLNRNSLEWKKLLSDDEISRSKRYRFEQDRMRFITRRGILRQLLGCYTGFEPAELAYHINPYGKLSLPYHPLKFNLSYSRNRAVFAFAKDIDIGVDIEQVRPIDKIDQIVRHCFSLSEQNDLYNLAPTKHVDAFFHVWTQKEAFIKAHGEGLSLPLQNFSVSVDPDNIGSMDSINCGLGDASHWQITSHVPEEGWRIAVCFKTENNLKVRWDNCGQANIMSALTFE